MRCIFILLYNIYGPNLLWHPLNKLNGIIFIRCVAPVYIECKNNRNTQITQKEGSSMAKLFSMRENSTVVCVQCIVIQIAIELQFYETENMNIKFSILLCCFACFYKSLCINTVFIKAFEVENGSAHGTTKKY